jgi:hypothetical protein
LENTPPPFPPQGGNKYGPRGKKYHKNNARANKKGEKEKRTREKKRKVTKDRPRTWFHKIMGNLEKNAGNRGHNIIFFPLLF